MSGNGYIVLVILLCTALTLFTRGLPFLIWGGNKEVPEKIRYLGLFLPMAVMGTLVIYCIRNANFLSGTHGLPEILSIALVAGTYVLKRSTFISIALGTLCYMFLIQAVF